jgi:ribonuclease HI
MGIGYTVELGSGEHLPGPARVLCRVGAQVGQGTNNEAEYLACVAGLRHCLRLGMWNVHIVTDSMLVYQQLRGKWKVREPSLKKLHGEAMVLLGLFNDYSLWHVPRERNADADALSHQIVFEEPDIGAPPPFGSIPRKFHFWQAAAIRLWWRLGLCRSGYLMGRIFNVDHTAIEQICDGRSYKGAGFDGRPTFRDDETTVTREQQAALGELIRGRPELRH